MSSSSNNNISNMNSDTGLGAVGSVGGNGNRIRIILGSNSILKEYVVFNNVLLVFIVILIIYLMFWCMDMSTSGYYFLAIIILLMIMMVHKSWLWMKDRDIIRR